MTDAQRRAIAVDQMAIHMKQVLGRNRHKGGWDAMHAGEILRRIFEEVRELDHAVADWDEYLDKNNTTAKQAIIKEAVDVANFCMFMVYRMEH